MTKRIVINNKDGTDEFSPEGHHSWRMKDKEKQMEKWRKQGKVDDAKEAKIYNHEREVHKWNVEDMKQVEKLNKNVAIIVPSHSGHVPWLGASLESCKATGFFVMLIYDNPFWKVKNLDKVLSPKTMQIADSVILKHRTYQRAVGVCHYWNMIYGLTLLKELGFPLVFNINGDCIMERPGGFQKIVEMLGDADLFPNQYIEEQRYCGTMGWIGKVDIMLDFFHTYREEAYMYSRTTEGRLWHYVKDKSLNVVKPVNCEHNYRIPSPGTWYDILGFRHLHAEWKVRPTLGMPPVEEKYIGK